MRDCIDIGPTPYEEACAQVGSDRYHRVYLKECAAFIRQLQRAFGEEPEGTQLRVKSNPHDFGTYHDVVCYYETDIPESLEYALKIEANTPAEWDDTAREELMSQKVCTAHGCEHDTIGCVEVERASLAPTSKLRKHLEG